MKEKEVSELRRRFKPEKSNISHIRGCYVNEKREIVSQFDQSVTLMPQEESEEILAVLKKTLSGTLGKNLLDVEFPTQQVMEGEAHQLLMTLRESSLTDEEAVQAFFAKVIQSLTMEGGYLILLAKDTYDVPYRSGDGSRQEDASSEVFSYILCSICPIKITKPALSYYVYENRFYNRTADWLVAPPELGFLFPAFDDRSTNLYNALYYSRNIAENHPEFAQAALASELPMPATEQKEIFGAVLSDALGQDCSYEVVQSVHEELCEMIQLHKENKEEEPLALSRGALKQLLGGCGVKEEELAAFEERYEEQFGKDAQLRPRNLIDPRRFEVHTADVTVKVDPARSDLVETRVIDGVKYLMIRVEEGVEVNGVPICIS